MNDLHLEEYLTPDEIDNLHFQLNEIFDYVTQDNNEIRRFVIQYNHKTNKTSFGTVGGRYNTSFIDYFRHLSPPETFENVCDVSNEFMCNILKRMYDGLYPENRKQLLYLRYYGKKNQRLELFGTIAHTRSLKKYTFQTNE